MMFGVFEGIRRKDVFRPDIVITKEATNNEYPHFVLEVPKKARVQRIKLTSEITVYVITYDDKEYGPTVEVYSLREKGDYAVMYQEAVIS